MAQRSAAHRPLIGITAGTTTMMSGAWAGHTAVTLTDHYVQAVRKAGARAVIISPQDPWSAEEVAELDGLIISGGNDLDPSTYGASPRPTDLPLNPARDRFETGLYRAARAAKVPVLGICRGFQIIVVAEGGTLHQHLPLDLPHYPHTGEALTSVTVTVHPDSDLAVAIDARREVTAFHHQGARTVPQSLRVVATHHSGLPLAVEAADGSYVSAVQWHPELDHDAHGLVTALLDAASESGVCDEASSHDASNLGAADQVAHPGETSGVCPTPSTLR